MQLAGKIPGKKCQKFSIGAQFENLSEFHKNRNLVLLIQVLRHQHAPLCKLASLLPAFGILFYPPELRESVQNLLTQFEGEYIERKK